MIQMEDSSASSDTETARRRSTFYVPLTEPSESEKRDPNDFSFDWSLNGSLNSTSDLLNTSEKENRIKRYGIVLNGSINIDDSIELPQNTSSRQNHSTPIRLMKARSRSNILSSLPDKTPLPASPGREKSKTLPQNLVPTANTFPPKSSFLLKSTPKIANCSSENSNQSSHTPSPKKSLSFIRRTHSTKLSRSNSLLRSLTSQKCAELNQFSQYNVVPLSVEQLDRCFRSESFEETVKKMFFKEKTPEPRAPLVVDDEDDDSGAHSDTSYEKACRRGSAPNTPILGQKSEQSQSTSRFTNFFSKRSNPLKRTKSVTKLERSKRGSGGLRGSRSHESLLSNNAVMSTIDLSCANAIGVAPVHSSVLGRRHCFQVRGDPRGERYYSCGSRQERDLWIYSLRKSIAPNAEHTRRTDNSLKMWIYEAKALPPKKKYFCEINLDKTLYGRTSVKLRTDLLFWGEYFDFPDVPDINVITVNVYREGEKKKKRDKHTLVGSVKIPIHDVMSRTFSEDWYPIVSEKHDSISKNSSKEPIPTLRIKCRFQSIDILPLEVYGDFLEYLRDNYKKVCEQLEPMIGVKAKEDIGQALVLLMHAQGMAGPFLTDVVALDLLRVGDQRLTFRGNSLATKSMEAFLKLTGEQYLQDTLSAPISEIISSDRDCEVDPLKATGSLSRQQQALRQAVRTAWTAIVDSHKHFPAQLRECFATFRERLQMLDREDMADNLISASIFLRFLCPAILSPSLFNITNELPSARATRNLTLVAKTLQTLANFTRFQGKENFMEFLNDFLEQEAPRMKNFLHMISTRPEIPVQESIHDWAGYIDQGKQLSILHSLLTESIQKLSREKLHDLHPLPLILDQLTQAKEANGFNTQSLKIQPTHLQSPNQENYNPVQQFVPKPAERGVIRGVLTPSSLEKNIFRYNDPTVQPLLNQSNQLQHSHSTSSISSHHSSNYTNNSHPHKPQMGVYSGHNHQHQHQHQNGYYTSGRRSPPVMNSGIRASTLPRNNYGSNIVINQQHEVEEQPVSNMIQIGVDQSKAFIRKSPTPLLKNGHLGGSRNRNLNSSQLSLLSEHSIGRNALSLGIPHTDAMPQHPNTHQMPLNLEDLDDLLKYADEQHDDVPGGNKEKVTTKGSNISIGQISNVCSSGYQSITTQSQSSSPVELQTPASQVNDFGKNRQKIAAKPYPGHHVVPKYTASVNINYNNNNPPLAFKNPLYQLQKTASNNNNNLKSSSLTPSSSEERLNGGDYCNLNNGNFINSAARRLGSTAVTPRTNPNMQYGGSKQEDTSSETPSIPYFHGNGHISRYQRRLSLESARTLSDSSTDTEGIQVNPTQLPPHHHHHHTEGKRRRNTSRSVEQCEREIQRLQASVDSLRKKLSLEDLKEATTLEEAQQQHSDGKIRNIISRLMAMEEELQREKYKMSMVLSHKQRVIEAQGQQIAALDAANTRLLNALSSLRSRYEGNGNGNLQGGSGSLC